MTRHGKRPGSPFNGEKVMAALNPARHAPAVTWWLEAAAPAPVDPADFYELAKREAGRMRVSKIAHSLQRVAYAPAS